MEDALEYHRMGRKGKLEVVPTKLFMTQRDLSLAYTPGVAEPCKIIQKSPEAALEYTARGNLVAVVTNETAVLGLGNIGALAGKPVMEGKAVLFKRFSDIDVFDLEINSEDPEDVIRVCTLLEPPSEVSIWRISRPLSASTSNRLSKGNSRFRSSTMTSMEAPSFLVPGC